MIVCGHFQSGLTVGVLDADASSLSNQENNKIVVILIDSSEQRGNS